MKENKRPKYTFQILFGYFEISKHEYYNFKRSEKLSDIRTEHLKDLAIKLDEIFVKTGMRFGSEDLAAEGTRINGEVMSRQYVDKVKTFLKSNLVFSKQNEQITLQLPWVKRSRRNFGCTKVIRDKKYVGKYLIMSKFVNGGNVVLTDATKITEIVLPCPIYISFYHSIFDTILGFVLTSKNDSLANGKGLCLAIQNIRNPTGGILQSDQGVETCNERVQNILDEFQMTRSNTTKEMKTKQGTEPINGKFKNEVIYNLMKRGGARKEWGTNDPYANLKLLIRKLKEWVFNYNNSRNFKMNEETIQGCKKNAKDKLNYYKGSTLFHANYAIYLPDEIKANLNV